MLMFLILLLLLTSPFVICDDTQALRNVVKCLCEGNTVGEFASCCSSHHNGASITLSDTQGFISSLSLDYRGQYVTGLFVLSSLLSFLSLPLQTNWQQRTYFHSIWLFFLSLQFVCIILYSFHLFLSINSKVFFPRFYFISLFRFICWSYSSKLSSVSSSLYLSPISSTMNFLITQSHPFLLKCSMTLNIFYISSFFPVFDSFICFFYNLTRNHLTSLPSGVFDDLTLLEILFLISLFHFCFFSFSLHELEFTHYSPSRHLLQANNDACIDDNPFI